MTDRPSQLYLITPPAFEPAAFRPALEDALSGGPVAALQLRLKEAPDDLVKAAVDALLPVTRTAGVAMIINDRPDIAIETGADGAHVGQSDMGVAEARKLLGPARILGATCHASRDLAMRAGAAGADYVAFGSFFPTATKPDASPASPEILTWWHDLFELPSVAIGGITPENASPLIDAGADFLAVSNAVWTHPDGPAAAVAAFDRLMRGS